MECLQKKLKSGVHSGIVLILIMPWQCLCHDRACTVIWSRTYNAIWSSLLKYTLYDILCKIYDAIQVGLISYHITSYLTVGNYLVLLLLEHVQYNM